MDPNSFTLKVSHANQANIAGPSGYMFPTAYLGESFKIHIELRPSTQLLALRVVVHAPSNQQYPLTELFTEAENPLVVDLNHEINELGPHTLVCLVSSPAVPSFPYREQYTFNAENPLSVKTKSHVSQLSNTAYLDATLQTCFLEVQISNSVLAPLSLSLVSFTPAMGFSCIDGTPSSSSLSSQSSSSYPTLISQDLHKLLFVLKPDTLDTNAIIKATADGSFPLGSLNIEWSIPSTEQSGRLQTSTLFRRLPSSSTTSPFSHSNSLSLSSAPLPSTSSSSIRKSLSTPLSSSATRQQNLEVQFVPSDVKFSLCVTEIRPERVFVDEPFQVKVKLHMMREPASSSSSATTTTSTAAANIPTLVGEPSFVPRNSNRTKPRMRTERLRIALQHIRPNNDEFKHRYVEEEVANALEEESRSVEKEAERNTNTIHGTNFIYPAPFRASPLAYNTRERNRGPMASASVLQMGASLVHMKDVVEFRKEEEGSEEITREITLEYMAQQRGIARIGGLRILGHRDLEIDGVEQVDVPCVGEVEVLSEVFVS